MSSLPSDFTPQLQKMMEQAGITSFKALGRAAGVSDWQVKCLRAGRASQIRGAALLQLSQALGVPIAELLHTFSALPSEHPAQSRADSQELADLRREYDRLQQELEQQRQTLEQDFQRSSLQVLESWMLHWSAAAYAAQQNPQLPAVRLLPLVRPVETLLHQWQVETIAPVGAEVPYDPQLHQLMEGTATPGEPVRIRYAGYFHRGSLLYRAKVSPLPKPDA